MNDKTLFIAITSQKGGVGKSALTVITASLLHYEKGLNVAVIDCDYPQLSVSSMRTRDMDMINKIPEYQELLLKQHDKTSKGPYPVLKAEPESALNVAIDFLTKAGKEYDIVFFDFPGTVANDGVLNAVMNMDYIFIPVIPDQIILNSSLYFAVAVEKYKQKFPDVTLQDIYLFWNKLDKRENKEVYERYHSTMAKLHLKNLDTELPDSKKFNRELTFGKRLVFRSTMFPPNKRLLRGSNMNFFIEELLRVVNLNGE